MAKDNIPDITSCFNNGKGSRNRVTDKKSYDENYERIFGKKEDKNNNDKKANQTNNQDK